MKKLTKRSLMEERLQMLKDMSMYKNLTVAEHDEISSLERKILASKKGTSSKRKGATYERRIAKTFKDKFGIDLVRTPMSGGFAKKSEKADAFRGDITSVDKNTTFKLHIEAKCQKTWKLKDWLNQAQEDCPEYAKPVVIFHKSQQIVEGKVVEKPDDYVALRLSDFLELVRKEDIIQKKVVD